MSVIVLHTTEGPSVESAVRTMRANKSESNWVYDPETEEFVTLKPTVGGDRSLRNLPGGVETNNREGVWQLEVVANAETVDQKPEYWFRRLGAKLRELCDLTGTPKVVPYAFAAYRRTPPSSYGLKAAQRLSHAAWRKVQGVVGHQHVPENDHGDPGDLNRVIPYLVDPPTEEELEVTYTEAMRALDELWLAYRGVVPSGEGPKSDRRVWGRILAEAIFRKGEPAEPVLAFVEWKLREQFEAEQK